jgi:hypothetical protein
MNAYGGLFPSLDEAIGDGLDDRSSELSRPPCGHSPAQVFADVLDV